MALRRSYCTLEADLAAAVAAQVGEREADHRERRAGPAATATAGVAGDDDVVDDLPGDQRHDGLQRRAEHRGAEGEHDVAAVPQQVAPQPAHPARRRSLGSRSAGCCGRSASVTTSASPPVGIALVGRRTPAASRPASSGVRRRRAGADMARWTVRSNGSPAQQELPADDQHGPGRRVVAGSRVERLVRGSRSEGRYVPAVTASSTSRRSAPASSQAGRTRVLAAEFEPQRRVAPERRDAQMHRRAAEGARVRAARRARPARRTAGRRRPRGRCRDPASQPASRAGSSAGEIGWSPSRLKRRACPRPATLGFVSAVPSANTTVGTVRLPPLTCMTSSAARRVLDVDLVEPIPSRCSPSSGERRSRTRWSCTSSPRWSEHAHDRPAFRNRRRALAGSGPWTPPDRSSAAAEAVLAGLDPEQRAAAEAVRGPVCILAGAGTGKTRAITHRIAYAVRTGAVPAAQLLAVTFTARAAGELRSRLRALGRAGRAGPHLPRRRPAPAAVLRAARPRRRDARRRRQPAAPGRQRGRPAAAAGRPHRAARPRRRDRLGEGGARHAGGLRRAGRARPAARRARRPTRSPRSTPSTSRPRSAPA